MFHQWHNYKRLYYCVLLHSILAIFDGGGQMSKFEMLLNYQTDFYEMKFLESIYKIRFMHGGVQRRSQFGNLMAFLSYNYRIISMGWLNLTSLDIFISIFEN